MHTRVTTLQQFSDAIKDIFEHIKTAPETDHATVVCLSGDLGAGKTTATQIIARHLDIIEPVTSPTFVIKKNYPITHGPLTKLVHIDAYRLEHETNHDSLLFDQDVADPHNLVIIEWPQYIQEQLPQVVHHITITHDASGRTITHKKTS